MQARSPAVAAVFDPVQTATTLEETVERLGTAIRLGLLGPGDRLPPERDLADQLGIARSTLRQALTSLTESGHLIALRGRGGGTFVSDAPPLAESSRVVLDAGHWREVLDQRIAVEVGTAVLASERAAPDDLLRLREHVETMRIVEDFSAYRRADVFFHLGIAEAARSARLLAAMTELQGQMSELIGHIAHPAPVLARSNEQHADLVAALERRDGWAAAQIVREHLKGTEQVLAGLMP
ncbi:MAG TPA: FCD domain-containing protein [Solirubrobacteraceae bacterium]|jgi:GntR family transcriptional repressor for pyruvate dehydrogenase complex